MILSAEPPAAARAKARRVLFLNANETMRPYRVAPLGLAFVASATRAAGHEVRFVDLPETAAQHRAIRRLLTEWRADYLAVGVRNLDNSDFHGFESYLRQPASLVAEARRARPEICVILGGPAATVDPQLVLRVVQPDYVVLGEGEESLSQTIARLEAGEELPEIIGADELARVPFRVANAAHLPAPRLYEWVPDLRPYLRGDAGYPLQTKRGCPLKCTYCTYGRIEGTRYRFLDPQAIADEVEGAMERGVRDFEFVDSTFNLPPRHALGILSALRERKLHANYVGTGLNPSKLPDELLAAMREVGFRSVILTAESASDTMLASYQKNYQRGQLHHAADLLARHDITALWVFLLGGPQETETTVGETLSFIEERVHSPHAVYITSGIRIYAGSPIADSADAGLFVKEDLRQRAELPGLEFFYSHDTPPDWLEARLRAFQARHPHVMLSCEGHTATTHLALRVMSYLPFRKPYWQYIPALNRMRRLFFFPQRMKLRFALFLFFVPFALRADEIWNGTSDVQFRGYSTLHNFEGTVTQVPLKVTVSGKKNERMVSATSSVPVKQMNTAKPERDRNMWTMFQEAQYRLIKVEVNRAAERDLHPPGGKPGTMAVTLTIAGTRGTVNAAVNNVSESSSQGSFDLTFPVSLKAFKLDPPSGLAGLVKVRDTVDVTVHVVLKKDGSP